MVLIINRSNGTYEIFQIERLHDILCTVLLRNDRLSFFGFGQRVLKREDKQPIVTIYGHGFPSIKNW